MLKYKSKFDPKPIFKAGAPRGKNYLMDWFYDISEDRR